MVHPPVSISLRKTSRHTCDSRLCGPENRPGCCGKEKDILSLPRIERTILDRPALSVVIVPIELSRVR